MLILIYLLLVPWLVIRLSKRWRWIDKVSPMTVLYAIGLVVGNIGLVGDRAFGLCNTTSSLAVPLAIPLMLMGCNLSSWSTGKALKVFLTGIVSVLITTVAGFFLFSGHGTLEYRDYAQVCAVATGIYTGGIPNIGAIAKGVGMGNELYLIVTSSDLIITGLYLLFVIFFGKQVFRKILPATSPASKADAAVIEQEETKAKPFSRQHWRGSLLLILLTIAIAALSYGLALLPSRGGEVNMTVLILLLTTLAIGASFLKPVRRQTQSFDMGLYCVYVFCLAIATMVNVRDLNLAENLTVLYYIVFIIFGSLVLQFLFAKLLRIDGDSVLVSSVALINSPPFVPLVAALLENKDVVVLGVSIGLLGYMIGNYLGIGIYHVLMLFGG